MVIALASDLSKTINPLHVFGSDQMAIDQGQAALGFVGFGV